MVEPISGKYDVIVVGAGIMGSSSAYYLARHGFSVILIEQYDFLHRRGSSHGESRIIRPTYPEDYYTAMMTRAYQLWEEAELEAGYCVLTKTGGLDFGPRANSDLQAVLTSCRKHGVLHQVLDAQEVYQRFSFHLKPEDIGVYNTEAGILHATKACAMFQQLARDHGASLRDRSAVTHICASGEEKYGIRVETSRGIVYGSHCVVSAGAWTQKIIKSISQTVLPVQPLHTAVSYWQVVHAPAAAAAAADDDDNNNNIHNNHDAVSSGDGKFSVRSNFPVFINYDEHYVYGMPVNEYPGLIKVCLHSGSACNPDNRQMVPDVSSIHNILCPWVKEIFQNDVDSRAPVMSEACMYSMTPDQDFILDFVDVGGKEDKNCEEAARVLVLGGFSGHGFKMAPLIGKIALDMILHGSSSEVDMELFSIKRFSLNADGNIKSINPQVRSHSTLNISSNTTSSSIDDAPTS